MVLVIDPQAAGVSGDMMLSALVGLGADGDRIVSGVRAAEGLLPGSAIREMAFERVSKHGVAAVQLRLAVDEDARHRRGAEMRAAVVGAAGAAGLSPAARAFAASSVDSLIGSESRVHGVPEDSVHFHEASGIDTLVDILGTAIALDDLGLYGERTVCMPVAVGGGSVTFSHGTMSNPASAVLEIFRGSGLLMRGGPDGCELATPTGACMLAALAGGPAEYYPQMAVESVGYGAGRRDLADRANVLKLVRGPGGPPGTDRVAVLETSVDDASGEVLGGAVDVMMAAGALDASIYHGIAKKGRPACLVRVVCGTGDAARLAGILMRETGTLGVRVSESSRIVAQRTSHTARVRVLGREFEVSYKRSLGGFKIEFDDVRRVAGAVSRPAREAESLLRRAIEEGDDAGN